MPRGRHRPVTAVPPRLEVLDHDPHVARSQVLTGKVLYQDGSAVELRLIVLPTERE
jgi:hypothetical protein